MQWRDSEVTEMLRGHRGEILVTKGEGYTLSLYHDEHERLYRWTWGSLVLPPVLFVDAVNEFLALSQLLPDGTQATVSARDEEKWHEVRVTTPLPINERGFLGGLKIETMRTVRVELPSSMFAARETHHWNAGESCRRTGTGISFLAEYDERRVQLAIRGTGLPGEAVARLYTRTTGLPFTADERRRLASIIVEHSTIPNT